MTLWSILATKLIYVSMALQFDMPTVDASEQAHESFAVQ